MSGDVLLSILILLVMFLVIYSKYNNQSIVETLKSIKAAIAELKEETPKKDG